MFYRPGPDAVIAERLLATPFWFGPRPGEVV